MKRRSKSLPRNVRLLTGNPGHRRLPKDEPKVSVCMPDAPYYLTELAREEWDRIVKLLANMGVMSEPDITALALYCEAFGRWRMAIAKVSEDSPVIKNIGGNMVRNPYLLVANKAHDQMLKLLVEFGLTPSSRTRVQVSGGESGWGDL